ncbi:MAG: glycoside hydrolase family 28 protein [Clostridia bacterium]|nr:glycoside hydrolase family 28 protein [Clostridia bacterium]
MSNYNVLTYGAAGNGAHDDAASIQAAIDACFAAGGGRVVLPGGHTYLSSSLRLRANVELYVDKGAVLKATGDLNGYIRPNETVNDPKTALIGNPVTGKPSFVFLYGYEAHGCAIAGAGVIDGHADAFVKRKDRYYVTGDFYPRPTTIYVEKSDHVTFCDFTVRNAPFWTLHPAGCDDVLIRNIRILNDLDVANSDGIDPDHCRNVRILGCHIVCADDCICLKTTKGNAEYGPCENIVIDGCTLTSTSAAIKIGTEGVADFRNVLVSNCVISRSNRGLSIQIRDGGSVENVSYQNIMIETRRFSSDWWGTAEPIVLTAFDRDENTRSGSIRNVRFFNVTAVGENGVLLHGTADNPIRDVTFDRCSVTVTKTSKWPCGLYDLRPCLAYGVETADNAAFYLRYADRVALVDTRAAFGTVCDSYRHALDAEHVTGLDLRRFEGRGAHPEDAAVRSC